MRVDPRLEPLCDSLYINPLDLRPTLDASTPINESRAMNGFVAADASDRDERAARFAGHVAPVAPDLLLRCDGVDDDCLSSTHRVASQARDDLVRDQERVLISTDAASQ